MSGEEISYDKQTLCWGECQEASGSNTGIDPEELSITDYNHSGSFGSEVNISFEDHQPDSMSYISLDDNRTIVDESIENQSFNLEGKGQKIYSVIGSWTDADGEVTGSMVFTFNIDIAE
ncbi:hypothetical protein [Jeotgalibacillus haloalkalitolerans]|uniref:Uncharacterized protein n=1 Tax=Jeotgalibacillus haloalkalitolerans TaxID=3104292 RepID=A0ABU5KNI0_9BACL|nr:hypothetical protein [Jeotgalibacillus sp. HH7-29]MDZ5712712.1 hypothetical protein [Jeotgalibacillus sp. HH7-29]